MNFSTSDYDTHSVLRMNNVNLSFVEFNKYLGVFINRKFGFTKKYRLVI